MATMNISLPEEMKTFVEEQASKRGFGTVSEYMRAMIREAQERLAARERVDSLLHDGLASGPSAPMTKTDWEQIRSEVQARQIQRQGRTNGPKATKGR